MHLGRKSSAQRLLDTLDQSMKVVQDVRPALEHLGSATSGKSTGQRMLDSLSRSVTPSKMPRIGIEQGPQGRTHRGRQRRRAHRGQCGISSLRRRSEGSREDS